jgi:hypothetical protein
LSPEELAHFTEERTFGSNNSRDVRLFHVSQDDVRWIVKYLVSLATTSQLTAELVAHHPSAPAVGLPSSCAQSRGRRTGSPSGAYS